MTTASAPVTHRLTYNRTIGVAAMQGRGFYYPWSADIASNGRVYVLGRGLDNDPRGVRITVMDLEEEYYGTWGEFGTGEGQSIWNADIVIDAEDRVYTTDESLNRILVRTTDGELLNTWGEPGSAPGQLNGPSGIAINSRQELVISDHLNGRIQTFTRDGVHLSTFAETGSGDGQLNLPWGVCVDTADNIYVADWSNDRIVKLSPTGNFLASFGKSGRGDGELNAPSSVCVDRDGYMYVADWGNQRLQVFDADGGFVQTERGQATNSKWAQEFLDINVEEKAAREKSDLEPHIEFNTDDPHEESAHIEKYLWGPTCVMLDSENHLFVVDSNRHRLQVFDVG